MATIEPALSFGEMCIHPDVGVMSLLYGEDELDHWTTLTHWRADAVDTGLACRTHMVVREHTAFVSPAIPRLVRRSQ